MKRSGFGAVLTGGLLFCILVSVSPYWDQYITDAGVFIKQRLREPYYIFQQDYDRAETAVYEINGQAVYYPVNGEINDCHVYPGTCYRFMIERSTLISEEIEDGFRAQ